MKSLKKIFKGQVLSIYIALIAIVILFSILSPNFRTFSNLLTVLRQIAGIGIMACGMMFVMLLGNVDLSVGTQISLLGIVMSYCMVNLKWGIFPSIMVGIVLGLLIGLINGLVITYCKIPSMIATLGTSWIFQGISYTICNAQPIFGFPAGFSKLGQGLFLGVPIPIYLFILCCIIASIVFNKTAYGRTLYAAGSNDVAAKLSGVNVNLMKVSSYIICACFSILASIVFLSRVNSGNASTGIGQEMNVLTACVLGGICFTGGDGQVSGTIAGVMIIGVIQNGLVMLGAGQYVQLMVKGLILIFALSIDTIKKAIESRKPTTAK